MQVPLIVGIAVEVEAGDGVDAEERPHVPLDEFSRRVDRRYARADGLLREPGERGSRRVVAVAAHRRIEVSIGLCEVTGGDNDQQDGRHLARTG